VSRGHFIFQTKPYKARVGFSCACAFFHSVVLRIEPAILGTEDRWRSLEEQIIGSSATQMRECYGAEDPAGAPLGAEELGFEEAPGSLGDELPTEESPGVVLLPDAFESILCRCRWCGEAA